MANGRGILPIFNSLSKELSLLQTGWSALIDPIIGRAQNKSNILQNIVLISGTNVINHLLGRKMQGWSIVDINSAAQVYRSVPFNDLTLTLISDAITTVNIEVF